MVKATKPEVWLRGPLPAIHPLLQPAAHALLQARDEVNLIMADFPESLLWTRVAGLASPGFHLQHLTGVLDRIFTYARAQTLDTVQLQALAAEGTDNGSTLNTLVQLFNSQVDRAINQLSHTDGQTLTHRRGVGRQQIPSTVIGLLFHAAEHTMRHTGQLLVTVKVLKHSV